MSKRKRRRYRTATPPPADGHRYVLVRTKEGPYWRKKRGTVKKAELNEVFQRNAEATSLASPVAKRIKGKLEEFFNGLDTGRFIANISAKLKKTYLTTGAWNFSLLEGYDLQPDHPLTELFRGNYYIIKNKDELTIRIPIDKEIVKRHNKLVTDYYFGSIILYGDPSKKNDLLIESETSKLYPATGKFKTECNLSLSLPAKKTPWMILLKLSCLEGNTPAAHPRHYGMKVVKVGMP